MELSLPQQNNAIAAFMGGPASLKALFFKNWTMMEEELHLLGPEDLMFHTSWDWLMPVWKKLRKELLSTQDNGSMLFALSKALDDVDIEAFHRLVAVYCVGWCNRKQIKL
jgi:hypothetical protein